MIRLLNHTGILQGRIAWRRTLRIFSPLTFTKVELTFAIWWNTECEISLKLLSLISNLFLVSLVFVRFQANRASLSQDGGSSSNQRKSVLEFQSLDQRFVASKPRTCFPGFKTLENSARNVAQPRLTCDGKKESHRSTIATPISTSTLAFAAFGSLLLKHKSKTPPAVECFPFIGRKIYLNCTKCRNSVLNLEQNHGIKESFRFGATSIYARPPR